ncbi:MAG TPA: TonB-dependent receptor plug domain-containing protein, partial [Tepidisphaeraceae bacterium]
MNLARLLGATALAGSFLVSAPVWAQAAPNVGSPATDAAQTTTPSAGQEAEDQAAAANADGSESEGGTVVVTGSRIPRPERDGVLPGVQLGAEQLTTRGFTNVADALNDIPLVGPSGANVNSAAPGQAFSIGNAFVDLLDLGTSRTLTLVNGRRFVSGNSASLFVADNAPGGQVDVNVIPSALIDRIDVLTVGGAAAYGADAVAGVVNYILKDRFEGTELTALTGISERGDAAQYTLRATTGFNIGERANIVVAAEYNRIEGLQADRRDFRQTLPQFGASFLNGATRNPAFIAAIPISQAA